MGYIYIWQDNYNNEPSEVAYTKPIDVLHAVLEDIQENELEIVELNFNKESYLNILEKYHDITICTCSINYRIYKIPVESI